MMTDKLKILDMTKGQQLGWMLTICTEHNACCPADLAFRLRDEVKNRWRYYQALRLIFRRWSEKKQSRGIDFRCWLGTFITPTDMIVAALKAKELAKE